jgi:hypothetical protein
MKKTAVSTFKVAAPAVAILLAFLTGGSFARAASIEIKPAFEGLRPGEDAQETYDLNAVGLRETSTIVPTVGGVVQSPEDWVPLVGKYRNQISRPDFVRLIGREDLLRSYGHRKIAGAVLLAIGAAAIGSGIYLKTRPNPSSGLVWGLVGGGALTIGLGIAGLSSSSIMTAPEAEEAATRYNAALRAHLALPPVPTGSSSGPSADTRRSLAARLLAGLRVGLTAQGRPAGALSLSF